MSICSEGRVCDQVVGSFFLTGVTNDQVTRHSSGQQSFARSISRAPCPPCSLTSTCIWSPCFCKAGHRTCRPNFDILATKMAIVPSWLAHYVPTMTPKMLLRLTDDTGTTPGISTSATHVVIGYWTHNWENVLVWRGSSRASCLGSRAFVGHAYHWYLRDSQTPSTWRHCWDNY